MLNIISTGSNYIFMIMCAIYALSCFTVFLPSTEEQQIKRMNRQERFMFIFHFICYGVLFLKTFDVRILILYVAQAVFFKFLIFLYEHLYMDCSRILMNHTCFLLIIGFVMLTRLDFAEALKQFAIVAVCSFVVLAVPFIMEKAYWLKRLRWIYGLIGLLLLASVFVIGTTKNGSTNWISLGPVALQPSEFVKIAFIFFLAAMLEKPVSFPRVFVTALFSACHVLVLILERDLGGALLYFVVFIFLCYASTGRSIYVLGGVAAGTLAGRLAYILFAHVRTRFDAWSDPWSIIEGRGYQITQSLFAIGTGGWFGMGLYQGMPEKIPVVNKDFIFAAVCEELGGLYALCLLAVCLCCFFQFVIIAMKMRAMFYKLIAFGLGTVYITQVFLTVGGAVKFIPSTGVTLPFVSYGGSSLLASFALFNIIQGLYILKREEEADEKG